MSVNNYQRYKYIVTSKPLRFEARSLEELAKQLGLNKQTVLSLVHQKENNQLLNFLNVEKISLKKEKIFTKK